ncbi:MAG: hypothetical protein SVK54_00070, partial [candidate division WOR-3 bacterium]|nr:hypothetical protein [candidate division WOR-3 bacterium]
MKKIILLMYIAVLALSLHSEFFLYENLPSYEKDAVRPVKIFADSIVGEVKKKDWDILVFSVPEINSGNEEVDAIVKSVFYYSFKTNDIDMVPADSAELYQLKKMIRGQMGPKNEIFFKSNRLNFKEIKWSSPQVNISMQYIPMNEGQYKLSVSLTNLKTTAQLPCLSKTIFSTPQQIRNMRKRDIIIRWILFVISIIVFLALIVLIVLFIKRRSIEKNVDVIIDDINKLMMEHKYVTAVIKLKEALKYHPGSPELNELRTRIKLVLGDEFSVEAAEKYEKVRFLKKRIDIAIQNDNAGEIEVLKEQLIEYAGNSADVASE